MIVHRRTFGLEQSSKRFFRHYSTSWVFCDFKHHQTKLANHVAWLPTIRLFEVEIKVTFADIAPQMRGDTRTPVRTFPRR